MEREGCACDDLEIENCAIRYPLILQNFAHRKKNILDTNIQDTMLELQILRRRCNCYTTTHI